MDEDGLLYYQLRFNEIPTSALTPMRPYASGEGMNCPEPSTCRSCPVSSKRGSCEASNRELNALCRAECKLRGIT